MITVVAERTSSPVFKKSKSESSSSKDSVAKPLWKDKINKRKVEGRPCSEASGSCIQSQEVAVRLTKRPDEWWRTWCSPETTHLSWDKWGPVSSRVLMLYWPRMLRGWHIVRGWRWREVEGRSLRLFIKESDNKIKPHLLRCGKGMCCLPGHLRQCSSITVQLWKFLTFEWQDNQDLTYFWEEIVMIS